MVLNNMKVSIAGVKFDIELKNDLVLVEGDSGTGKTLLFKALVQYTGVYGSPLVFLNYERTFSDIDKIRDTLIKSRNKLIVIDNADIILDLEMRGRIALDRNGNQYLIFGRNIYGLGVTKRALCYLEIKNNIGKLKYKYI